MTVRVLYVGSWSRSGSTLLDLLLGKADGGLSCGELRLLWRRGIAENQLCGCAVPFDSCPFWRAVLAEAFGPAGPDVAAIEALQAAVDQPALVPVLAAPWQPRAFAARLAAYRAVLARLFGALAGVSGARFLVDSSKAPSHGLILAGTPGIELHVVHLVRDSRAVAHSWQRRKLMPEVHWEERYMPVFAPARSALFWNLENLALHTLRRAAASYRRLRYEDVVRDPAAALAPVLDLVAARPPHLAGGRLELSVNHTAAGNPLRLRRGALEVREDVAWKTEMGRGPAAHVTALTWPLLAHYGYLSRRA